MKATPLLFLGLFAPVAAADWDLTTLVFEGDVVFGGSTVTRIDNLAINDNLDWRVEVTTTDSTKNTLLGPSGAVAQEGQPFLAPAGATLRSFDALTLNNDGDSAVNFFLDGTSGSSDDSGVFFNLNLLVQEGAVSGAPEFGAGTTYRGFFETKLANDDDILLLASVDDPLIPTSVDQALIKMTVDGVGNLASENVLWKEGDTVPGTTGLITTFGTNPHQFDMNDTGSVIFFADTDLASGTDGFVILDGVVLAQEGQPSPIAGRNWSSLASPEVTLNNSGSYMYSGSLDGDSTTNTILIKDGAKFMQEGDQVPGMPAFTFTSFGSGPLDLADNGDVLWYGDWNDVDTDVDTGLFLNDELLVQEGVTTVGGVPIDTLRGVQDGYFISDDGRFIIFEAILDDGNEGAFLLTRKGEITSIPGCSTDGSTLAHVGGTPSLGGSLDLQLFSPSTFTGARFLAVAGVNVLDGSGCGVDIPGVGEILIGFTPPNPFTIAAGTHTGTADVVSLPVPNNVALVGMPKFVQAYYLFPGDPSNLFDLTNALEVTVGL